MKVQGPSSTQAAQNARRSNGVAPGFVLPSGGTDAPTSTGRVGPLTNLTNISALLALQTEDDVTERRRRATARSNSLLDQMDGIRLSILGAGVSREQVTALANTLREYRDQVDDPGLDDILNDVEVRAEVELAKLERAL